MEREIWFEKWAWSYVPCHWKGCAAMTAVIMPTIATILLVHSAADAVGFPYADWLDLAIFLVGWITIMGIAKRHS